MRQIKKSLNIQNLQQIQEKEVIIQVFYILSRNILWA